MDRADWLKRRQSGLGGSDVAAILGLSPYRGPVDVWLDKTGEPREQDAVRLRYGAFVEDFVDAEYQRATGRRTQRHNALLRHPDHPFAIGNVDRLVIPADAKVAAHRGEIRTDRLLEIKTASIRMADRWGEPGTDKIPEHYAVQVAWYQALTGCTFADVAVLLGNDDLRIYTLQRDRELEAMLLSKAGEWWQRHVVDGVMPEPSTEREVGLLFPRSTEREVEATPDVVLDLAALRDVRARIDALETEAETIATRVKAHMAEADVLTAGGAKLATWRSAKGSMRLDVDALKTAEPDTYNRFLVEREGSRRFLLTKEKA
jgi:putative phage-type endonuclease